MSRRTRLTRLRGRHGIYELEINWKNVTITRGYVDEEGRFRCRGCVQICRADAEAVLSRLTELLADEED